jgi:MSHA biogenesis protein MshN
VYSRSAQPSMAAVAAPAAPVTAAAAVKSPAPATVAAVPEPPVAVQKPVEQPPVASAPPKMQPVPAPVLVAAVPSRTPALPATAPASAAAPPAVVATVAEPVRPAAPEALAVKSVNPQQSSENLYKNAAAHLQQGRDGAEAREMLRKSLEANPRNVAARQMLAGLLVESNNIDAAAALLQEGLKQSPEHGALSMSLARLQLERADVPGAILTLERGLPGADHADYYAFYAALLQRAGRNEAAVKHYLTALKTDPSMPTWLVGIGISLQAIGKDGDAVEAFQRARDTGRLAPTLAAFVDQRLGQLGR